MPRDYDKPKKSWREIDSRKDQSAHRRDDRPGKNPFAQARANNASSMYRAELDSFFDGEGKAPAHMREKFAALTDSKEGKERKTAAAKIVDAKTSSAKTAAVKDYLKKWELPPDYSILAEVLLCSDDLLVEQALDEIDKMFDANRIPKRKALLEQRFKSLVSLTDDEDVEEKASALLKKIRIF
jgi:aminopeptidase N